MSSHVVNTSTCQYANLMGPLHSESHIAARLDGIVANLIVHQVQRRFAGDAEDILPANAQGGYLSARKNHSREVGWIS